MPRCSGPSSSSPSRPVSPDRARVVDLLEALAANEPLARDVLIVDDERPVRSFAHPRLRVDVIANPRRGRGIPTLGGTTAATLAGLAWVAAERSGSVGPAPGRRRVGHRPVRARRCRPHWSPGSASSARATAPATAKCATSARSGPKSSVTRVPSGPGGGHRRRPWWVRPADRHVRCVSAGRGGLRLPARGALHRCRLRDQPGARAARWRPAGGCRTRAAGSASVWGTTWCSGRCPVPVA